MSNTEGDWVEDFGSNSTYFCKCNLCGSVFGGHLGRDICKTCHDALKFPEAIYYCIKPDGRTKYTLCKDRAAVWANTAGHVVREYTRNNVNNN